MKITEDGQALYASYANYVEWQVQEKYYLILKYYLKFMKPFWNCIFVRMLFN